jgi:DNA-binding CsgD family transcriptional regulator
MALSPQTEHALELCSDALIAPEQWAAALDELAHSLGAKACMILPHEVTDRDFGVVGSSEISKLNELWNRNLDWVAPVYEPRGDRFVRSGFEAVNQCDLFTDDEIRCSRFHQEIAKPAGLLHWASGIFFAEGRYWCMPISRETDPFLAADVDVLIEVSRRMARVVSISAKLSISNAENEVTTLERIGCAAILIDRIGYVRRLNHHAEKLLCSDLAIRRGKLWTSASSGLTRLDRFLSEIDNSKRTGGPLPHPVILARDGKPWLLVEALPLTAASMEVFDGCRAIILLNDLTRTSTTNAAVLGVVYGFTRAESRLAAALCEGNDLNTLAKTFDVSHETLRGQLKTIFAKTGVRRQAELVSRLARVSTTSQH